MPYKYPWYTKVADAVHRLTVLSLVGGSLYIIGGLSWTIYKNGRNYEKKVTEQPVSHILFLFS
ncbi:CYFA0S29e00672g1_1 [Cyberlindnera fabianii]|uniref:CYFA0S29e00672g1_1 n=1 Tax=Cyberlindnera fabianii TaxID=36022 RepID=A0A061BB24_CYBFA|nr:CYFA0S29e00672g1_1 [Cyberlindnera fabianii]